MRYSPEKHLFSFLHLTAFFIFFIRSVSLYSSSKSVACHHFIVKKVELFNSNQVRRKREKKERETHWLLETELSFPCPLSFFTILFHIPFFIPCSLVPWCNSPFLFPYFFLSLHPLWIKISFEPFFSFSPFFQNEPWSSDLSVDRCSETRFTCSLLLSWDVFKLQRNVPMMKRRPTKAI